MFEKVNPCHPDKVADRIAGALVDLAYKKQENARMAAEVLIGHGSCRIIAETSAEIAQEEAAAIVERIAGKRLNVVYTSVPQDAILAGNQAAGMRCGDNGIFRGVPETLEQACLAGIAKTLYDRYPSDGKYILNGGRLIICQSKARSADILRLYPLAEVNPLGDWTGGIEVDTGATNRKLGSDMGDAVTGGGLHGKDLSKADVTLNICAHLEAEKRKNPVEYCCAIGDEFVDGRRYEEYVEIARGYINRIGGFEKFAEWGLIG